MRMETSGASDVLLHPEVMPFLFLTSNNSHEQQPNLQEPCQHPAASRGEERQMERVALSGLSLAGHPWLPAQAQPLCLQVEKQLVTDVQAFLCLSSMRLIDCSCREC